MKKRVTVREISKRAGVSHATVSYVLSGKADSEAIPLKTQNHVRAIADELGWHPNHVLSALSTGSTHLVGMWQTSLGEAYQSQVMKTMEQILREDGHAMLLSPAYASGADEHFDLGLFNKWSVDGVIGVDGPENIRHFLKTHPRWRLPMVSMGSYALTDDRLVDSVWVDVLTPIRQALERWLEEGRTHIAMLSAGFEEDSRGLLYRDFVRQHGLREEIIRFSKGQFQRTSAWEALSTYLRDHECPQALFCRSDETAIGAYRALRELGRSIPDEVALLGVDGIQTLDFLDHPVSTVVQPIETMCQTAWELLKERISQPDKSVCHTVLTATLKWREG